MKQKNISKPGLILLRIILAVIIAFQSVFLSSFNNARAYRSGASAEDAGPVLTVDAAANPHAINPDIYGLNFATEAFAKEIKLPVRRWGGNATSMYNWQTGATSAGMDWYFENFNNSNSVTNQDENHIQWIDQNVRTGSKSLLTVPMMGYVAKDNTSCSFSISKYGSQQDSDYWRPDCGNGIKPDGSRITGNDPTDIGLAVDETFVQGWVQSLVKKYGSGSSAGVSYYALDNEPEIWAETHRDVHPIPQSYDELMSKTLAYAAAIKTADPSAKILGYSSFGWSGYWYSELDGITAAQNGYTYFPDIETHGNLYQVPWYLSQLRQNDLATGKRLVDYLDLHNYTESGAALSLAGNATKQALRLRSTRSLWDPSYRDESWIGGNDQPVEWRNIRLIPRMHEWVDTYYPGTKLAITEYNFGGLESINGALAQADVLGIFGREALDMANLWAYPNTSDNLGYEHFESLPGAYAFRMYRNYDGAGGQFGDTSLSASSADQSKLSIFAARRSSDQALTLMVINKTSVPLTSALSLSNFPTAANAQVYNYSASNLLSIVKKPDITISGSAFSTTYPANSITLLVIGTSSQVSISGMTGVGAASLQYMDGTLKTALADGSGNYSITVPANWSGSITPAKTGVYAFVPVSKTFTDVKTNQVGQNFLATYLAVFVSDKNNDGYIRETKTGSGSGGLLYPTGLYLTVGDDALNRQYRAILSFNSAALPDNAILLSSKVKIKAQSSSVVNPLSVLGSLLVDIKKPYFGTKAGLGLDDFKATANLNSAGSLSRIPAGLEYVINLSGSALAFVNRSGLTQVRLRLKQATNRNNATEYVNFYSGDEIITANRPALEVIYRLP